MAAADLLVEDAGQLNPCCKSWRDQFCSKLQAGTECLRESAKVLVIKKDEEISQLRELLEKEKKAKEEEDRSGEVKFLEDAVARGQEEISELKELLQQEKNEDRSGEVKFLEDSVARGQEEISKLKELLQQKKNEDRSREVKILEDSVARGKKEISKLKELLQQEKNARKEEMAARVLLESGISFIESEFVSLNEMGSAMEMEMNKLKELAEKERKRGDLKERIAIAEKKKATDALTCVRNGRATADELRKKAEEYKVELESMKKQAAEADSKLASVTSIVDEFRMMLEAEKCNVVEERKRGDSEMAKADEFRMMLEAEKCNVIEERKRGDSEMAKAEEQQRKLAEKYRIKIEELQREAEEDQLSHQLEEYRTKIEELQGEARKVAQVNWKEKLNLKKEVDEIRLRWTLKYNEAGTKLEAGNQRVVREKKRADSEMVKAEEQRKVAEENRKMAMEEKSRADQLSHQLEEYRIKIEELQSASAETTLLEKELKLEKARVEHAEEVAALEKKHTDILLQELSCFKLDFSQMSSRLNALTIPISAGAAEDKEKTGDIANMQVIYLS